MKNLLFPVLALVFYAVANVILENKLSSKLSTLTIMMFYSGITFSIALIAWSIVRTSAPEFAMPRGSLLGIAILVGVLFFFADYFFVGAYTKGISLLVITSIVALVPVLSSLIKFFVSKEIPNMWHIGGYILAFLALIMFAKGNLAAK